MGESRSGDIGRPGRPEEGKKQAEKRAAQKPGPGPGQTKHFDRTRQLLAGAQVQGGLHLKYLYILHR